jgi:ADP-ribosylglycohydrolase
MEVKEKLLGGLWGSVLGDILGSPFEFQPKEGIKEILNREGLTLKTDIWSDDGALIFATADALSKKTTNPVEAIAGAFLRWFYEGEYTPAGRVFGYGRTTAEALKRLKEGTPPAKAGGKVERDNGNGSLMRILPAAFWAYFKIPHLKEKLEFIHAVSAITHAHPRAVLGCGIYSIAVWEILNKTPKEKIIQNVSRTVLNHYAKLPEFEKELVHYRRILDGTILSLKEDELNPSGYVVHTLEVSLWGFLRGKTFVDALERVISLGGDSDTTASLTGGLTGTYYGVGSIPHIWIEEISKRAYIEEIFKSFITTLLKED